MFERFYINANLPASSDLKFETVQKYREIFASFSVKEDDQLVGFRRIKTEKWDKENCDQFSKPFSLVFPDSPIYTDKTLFLKINRIHVLKNKSRKMMLKNYSALFLIKLLHVCSFRPDFNSFTVRKKLEK